MELKEMQQEIEMMQTKNENITKDLFKTNNLQKSQDDKL